MEHIRLHVKALGRTHQVECSSGSTVAELTRRICSLTLGVPSREQQLVSGGRRLRPAQLLRDAQLEHNDTVHMTLPLVGGGPGLAFLAKKTWHTTRLDNIERVWKAEEEEKKEAQRLLEKQRQLAEERQIGELKQAARAAGMQVQTRERLDWMYEGAVKSGPTVEDYAMGKAKPQDTSTTQLDQVRDSQAAGANFTTSTDAFLDQESKIRNDPMLSIKKREEEAFNEVAKNQFLMSQIKSEAKALKKDKKLDKKLKKAMKKAEKKEKKHGKDKDPRNFEASGALSRDPRRRSRSPHNNPRHTRSRSRSRSRGRRDERRRDRSASPKKQRGGGLQVRSREEDKELGPRSLMAWEQHQAQRRKEQEEKRRVEDLGKEKDFRKAESHGKQMGRSGNMSSASSGYTSKMSAEEKARRLAAMKGDAAAHSTKVAQSVTEQRAAFKAEEHEHLKNKHASFLDQTKAGAYGMGHDIDMEEMNRRKAHTRQKGNKDDANFLSR